MPAYNFKAMFTDVIENGCKTTTIRALRRDGRAPRVGQTAYLYTGMRTPKCRPLGNSEIDRVSEVCISELGALQIDGVVATVDEREVIANMDGFESYADLVKWFDDNHGLPFYGHLIRWGNA